MTQAHVGGFFKNENEARTALEKIRWPNGPICPKCGSTRTPFKIAAKPVHRRPTKKYPHGRVTPGRAGLYTCRDCREQFTVTVGTIFEHSRIPLSKWLTAFHLIASSKKGMSAHQLHRLLGITYRSAWFMAHRIRLAMARPPFSTKLAGRVVEADETFIGGKPENRHVGKRTPGKPKIPVVALVDRESGEVRTQVVANVTAKNLREIVTANVEAGSALMTDGASVYKGLAKQYQHASVDHVHDEYVRGDVHTNTVEGFFSILKRGVYGVYHHVSEKHLPRYLAEFEQRYNTRTARGYTDAQRAALAIRGAAGKRLTYRPLVGRAE